MTIDQRIAKLERKSRRLTAALACMGVAACAALLLGAAPNPVKKVVRAEKLEIVDVAGKVRIRLGRADEGFGVVVYDRFGKFRATLTDAPLGAAMSVSKDGGSISLLAMAEGAGITIRDRDGKARAVMLVEKDTPQFLIKDAEGNDLFSATK